MSRNLPLCLLATVFAMSPALVTTPARAQDAEQAAAEQRRAERRNQQAARNGDSAVAPASSAELSDADKAELEKKLNDAKTQRDADLASAQQTEKDAAKLEQKKAEIFSKFAAISTALRDQYVAKGGTADTPAATPAKAEAGKSKKTTTAAGSNKKLDDLRKKFATAQQKLSAENARHTSKLDDLQQDLKDATAGGNAKQIEKANKAIDKETTAYQSKKGDLQSQCDQLQSQIEALGG